MSLIDDFKTDCTLLEKQRQPDGEGGWINSWVETVSFRASIVKDGTLAARVAEAQGVKNVYTVTTAKNAGLDYHDVFKRNADGKIFRVTSDSDDSKSPEVASFSFEQVSAEEWTLPND